MQAEGAGRRQVIRWEGHEPWRPLDGARGRGAPAEPGGQTVWGLTGQGRGFVVGPQWDRQALADQHRVVAGARSDRCPLLLPPSGSAGDGLHQSGPADADPGPAARRHVSAGEVSAQQLLWASRGCVPVSEGGREGGAPSRKGQPGSHPREGLSPGLAPTPQACAGGPFRGLPGSRSWCSETGRRGCSRRIPT